ncbi:MAG: alanine racemase, partial [Mogibacterium diversum]|nr:alanine racemase [Mogibacterium diversum]
CMIDVTDVPGVAAGDEVVIMGRSGDDEISAEEIAGKIGTINYEILCDFGMRLHKIYIDNADGDDNTAN